MKRLALALTGLLACAHHVALRTDPAFASDEVAQIQRAADTWNPKLRADHQITVSPIGSWQVLKLRPPHSYNGECNTRLRTIWIDPVHPGASVYEVALHEQGHAIGLGHTTTGVMMPFTVSTEFTPEVLAECKRVGACK